MRFYLIQRVERRINNSISIRKQDNNYMTKEETTSAAEGKLKALQAAMSKIEKDFGKGSIMRMGDEQIENVEVIPTGSVALDTALGVGGYPRG